jgi:hypothetical protein
MTYEESSQEDKFYYCLENVYNSSFKDDPELSKLFNPIKEIDSTGAAVD